VTETTEDMLARVMQATMTAVFGRPGISG